MLFEVIETVTHSDHQMHDQSRHLWIKPWIIGPMERALKIEIANGGDYLKGGNLWWRSEFDATISNASELISKAKFRVTYDDQLRRYACTSIAVEPPGKGAELTGATLRDLRLAETIHFAALLNIYVEASVVPGTASMVTTLDGVRCYSASDVLRLLPHVSGRTTDVDVRHAVLAYSIADVSGMPVLKTISEALNTSQSTAKRLVTRARELEYIDG